MSDYLVTWRINIEDADNVVDAALQALQIMQDRDSTALYFHVSHENGLGKTEIVDLYNYIDDEMVQS